MVADANLSSAIMYLKYLLLTLLSLFILLQNLCGQGIWNNIAVVGGVALSHQDRRLFDFPPAERILALEPKRLDRDLILYVEKSVFKYGSLHLDAGIGYAESNTSFGRPFDHIRLNGLHTYELRYVKKYTINKLVLPISSRWYIRKLYLQVVVLPTIGFRKSIVDNWGSDKRFTKKQLKWNGLEINPGMGFQLGNRLQICLNYRGLNFHEIDEVIFNYSLLRDQNHEFFKQKADKYNPFKMWLTVGYKLKK